MIQMATFVFNQFQENTYVLWDNTGECVIVDPGCYGSSEQQKLHTFITEQGLRPVKLLNTHCHIDHILGNTFITERYKIPLYLHQDEIFTYQDAARWSVMLGIKPCEVPENHIFITEKDIVSFGESTLKIALTPGHSIASLTFYSQTDLFALSGDVLFYESIGRTDLPGGSLETLLYSIKNTLFGWDDEMRIFSGHGPQTTIGHEKKYNPFLT